MAEQLGFNGFEKGGTFGGSIDAYAATPGTGPDGETCGSCGHSWYRERTRRYWKCELVKTTHGEATDIRVRTAACRLWIKKRGGKEVNDELYEEAVELVRKSGNATVSNLQRKFSIGYQRASRLMDAMEFRGVVGQQNGRHGRAILDYPINAEEGTAVCNVSFNNK
jgi:DNA segregation ATPase FtsK/SpoIIIE-like protein